MNNSFSRRKFIKNTAVAAGFTIVSGNVLGKALGYVAPVINSISRE